MNWHLNKLILFNLVFFHVLSGAQAQQLTFHGSQETRIALLTTPPKCADEPPIEEPEYQQIQRELLLCRIYPRPAERLTPIPQALRTIENDSEFLISIGDEERNEFLRHEHLRAPRTTYCGLTKIESWAISEYTSDYFYQLNRSLRSSNENDQRTARVYTRVLNRALSKLAKYEGVVYRTVNLPEHILNQHQPGEIVTYDAYTSTSTLNVTGFKHRLIIQSKTGRHLAILSANKHESEVLFKNGTQFRVLRAEPGAIPPTQFDIYLEEVSINDQRNQ